MNKILLKIKNINKAYPFLKKNLKKVLLDINFEIYQGEIISLLGVNGAGKTTLSSIIASLIPPSGGDILWEDSTIYENLLAYRRIIGFCPQNQNLDPSLTLEQNLIFQGRYYGLSKEEIKNRTEYLLKIFDLEEYAKLKVDVLSGGYKQRFSIARTLVHNPKLVILDEPTVGLDPQVRHKLWDYILFLKNEGISVLLTTHYLDEAEVLSDRVCVIDQGKIKILDTPEKLIKDLMKNNLEEVFLHLLKKEEAL
ncbi:MAG: ABC transporter ATP-binding protein [Parachlamydiales bacterium]|jgi:ABC-2 type transport system ATP-binding protein